MMDANASLQKWEHHCDLGQLLVLLFERVNCTFVDFAHRFSLVLCVEVAILQRHRELLAFALAE